ncbi:hypothetical protein AB1399_03960, partial [Hydrogenibacillus schlegelii]|uniref:hypothetical protein n=1 Tax=Hydrogenibacillus schlegelii TaxID=1484 RepID=UPI0034A08366
MIAALERLCEFRYPRLKGGEKHGLEFPSHPDRLLLTRQFPIGPDRLPEFEPIMQAANRIWNSCVWHSR